MKEHNMLKKICHKIGYDLFETGEYWVYKNDTLVKDQDYGDGGVSIVDVREIIFTPEFMEKYITYIEENINKETRVFYTMLEGSLRNPTEYLYNLIPGTKE